MLRYVSRLEEARNARIVFVGKHSGDEVVSGCVILTRRSTEEVSENVMGGWPNFRPVCGVL